MGADSQKNVIVENDAVACLDREDAGLKVPVDSIGGSYHIIVTAAGGHENAVSIGDAIEVIACNRCLYLP